MSGCPTARCKGQLTDPVASGVHDDGRHVEWRQCDRCGRYAETEVPLEHLSLFEEGPA